MFVCVNYYFYHFKMRDLAAAEHTLHARLAKNGKRTVYPKQTHNRMFLMTGEIMDQLDEIMTQLSH